VTVDGKRRKNPRFIVGLFDVLAFPALKEYYRLILNRKGKMSLQKITEKESLFKPSKVTGKTILRAGKTQFSFHDGKTLISDKAAKVGDTFILALPKLDVKEVLPLAAKAAVFLTRGRHAGSIGTLKEIKGNEVIYVDNGKDVETTKEYLFVVGKEKPVIEIKS
jgi:small subunit ribosomal protein S4e